MSFLKKFTAQDIINSILGISSLAVAVLTYLDKESIDKLQTIVQQQQVASDKQNTTNAFLALQLQDLDSSINILDSQLNVQSKINGDLLGILAQSNLQNGKLGVQIKLSREAMQTANQASLIKRKTDLNSLVILKDQFWLMNPTEGLGSLKKNRPLQIEFLDQNANALEKILQNPMLQENDTLVAGLLKLKSNLEYTRGLLKSNNEKIAIVIFDKLGNAIRDSSNVNIENYKETEFERYYNGYIQSFIGLVRYTGRKQDHL